MLNSPCPSCGGELSFRSKQSVFVVCSYCRSNIVRHDLDLELIGEVADLPADMSPIQLGTMGRYSGASFHVSGRVIYSWEDGVWNEWYLYFNDGRTGWLSEAQGEFAVSFPLETQNIPEEKSLRIGKEFRVKKNIYRVADIKKVVYAGSEGELPFKALKGYCSTVYDFVNKDSKFLTLEFPSEGNGSPLGYYGSYVSLARLSPQNLRMFEGWV